MSSKTPYIDAVSAALPSVLSDLLLTFDVYSRESLDTLVRFCLGGSCPPRIGNQSDQWHNGQTRLRTRVAEFDTQLLGKRSYDESGEATNGDSSSKKMKLANAHKDVTSAEDATAEKLFTLHSVSVTTPVRKKVHITITTHAILLENITSGVLESRIPLTSLKRVFLTSSIAKKRNKPRWTVLLLPSDTAEKSNPQSQLQLMFSVDQVPPNSKDLLSMTAYPGQMVSLSNGQDALPFLQAFLSHLPEDLNRIIALDRDHQNLPDSEHRGMPFTSSSGQPYVDAYRHAKEGCLYFLEEGILWSESRPCEFFALEDLMPDSEDLVAGGVKLLSATGRTITLYVRRREKYEDGDSEEGDEEEILEGDETEFAMIDGRESENVKKWVRTYKHLFGKPKTAMKSDKGKGKAKETEDEKARDSDASDSDFEEPSESDGGEPSSDSDDENEGEAGEGGAEATDASSDNDAEGESEGELDPARHPLLRPGAMPRMSQAVMDAAAAMLTNDMMGKPLAYEEEEEEDELE